MGDGFSFGPAGENRQPKGEQQIFQHLQIPDDGSALHLALAGDLAGVEHGGVRETGRFEESGKIADVAREALGQHLFLEVKADVGAQHGFRIRVGHDQWHEAQLEGLA